LQAEIDDVKVSIDVDDEAIPSDLLESPEGIEPEAASTSRLLPLVMGLGLILLLSFSSGATGRRRLGGRWSISNFLL